MDSKIRNLSNEELTCNNSLEADEEELCVYEDVDYLVDEDIEDYIPYIHIQPNDTPLNRNKMKEKTSLLHKKVEKSIQISQDTLQFIEDQRKETQIEQSVKANICMDNLHHTNHPSLDGLMPLLDTLSSKCKAKKPKSSFSKVTFF